MESSDFLIGITREGLMYFREIHTVQYSTVVHNEVEEFLFGVHQRIRKEFYDIKNRRLRAESEVQTEKLNSHHQVTSGSQNASVSNIITYIHAALCVCVCVT